MNHILKRYRNSQILTGDTVFRAFATAVIAAKPSQCRRPSKNLGVHLTIQNLLKEQVLLLYM